MKRYFSLLFTMMCLFSGYSWSVDYTVADMSIVNFINQKSHITKADVDKYKLLFLGRLGALTALGTASYGAYKVGTGVYGLSTEGLKSYIPTMVSGQTPEWATSKLVWTGVASLGTVAALFPTLYSRTQQGIEDKLRAFTDLCATLSVAKQSYRSPQEIYDNISPLWKARGVIAWCAALDNLIEQSIYASQLLEQLQAWGSSFDINQWAQTINFYYGNLVHNRRILDYELNAALSQRAADINARRADKLAGLVVSGAEAGVAGMHINNVTKVWNLLKDITEFGLRHKEAIGTAVTGIWLYRQFGK